MLRAKGPGRDYSHQVKLLRVMTVAALPSIRCGRMPDMPAVLELLESARLPTQDLDSAKRLQIWVMEAEGELFGVVGLECFGTSALLRSLAVASEHRRHGVARELVSRLEDEARRSGIERLVLLTETAAAFFCRLGYEPIERRDVPGEIKQSAEFHSLCPASAVCLTKLLNA